MWSIFGWIASIFALLLALILGAVAFSRWEYVFPAVFALLFVFVSNPLTLKRLRFLTNGWRIAGMLLLITFAGAGALVFAVIQSFGRSGSPEAQIATVAPGEGDDLLVAFDRARSYETEVAFNCSLLSTMIQLANAHNATSAEERTTFRDSDFVALAFGDVQFGLPSDTDAQRMDRFWTLVQRARIEDQYPGAEFETIAQRLVQETRDRWSASGRGPQSIFGADGGVTLQMLPEDKVCADDLGLALVARSP